MWTKDRMNAEERADDGSDERTDELLHDETNDRTESDRVVHPSEDAPRRPS